MKKIIILFCALVSLCACDNSLEINAPYKQIAIVYGFVDYNSPYQYIRVEKAFQNSSTQNATVSAQVSDSLYFKDIKVQIIANNYQDTLLCVKTDSIPKNSGFFASDKNYIYRTPYYVMNGPWTPVKIIITDTVTGNVFTSTTFLVSGQTIEPRPAPNEIDIVNKTKRITLTYALTGNSRSAAIVEGALRLKYYEAPSSNPSAKEVKTLDIVTSKETDQISVTQISYSFSFLWWQTFDYWTSYFQAQNNNVVREFIGLEFVTWGSGREYVDLKERSKLNTSVVQKKTDYSNIENGLGIFTCRTMDVQSNIVLTQNAKDLINTLPKFQ
ncbi:MAG: hypothetical protein V4643_04950 [Bacteroidota bacterium]